jgi:hypothetical protein
LGLGNRYYPNPHFGYAYDGLLWVLLALLGWHVFGPMIHA